MSKPTQHTLDHVKGMLLDSARIQRQLNGNDRPESAANKTMGMQNLDSDIEALQFSLNAIRESFETEIIRLSRLRNSLTPIESLPPEVLTTILHIALQYHPIKAWYKVLCQLFSVSSRWYHVILGTPSFWSAVHVHLTPKALAAALVRSGNHPLAVHCPEPTSTFSPAHPSSRTRPFFAATFAHIARWQSVNIGGLKSLQEIQGPLEQPALMLKKFRLRRRHGDDTGTPLNLFSGLAPRLETLVLHGVTIPWESPVLSGLSNLALTNVGNPVPSTTQILRILSNCPLLTHFTFGLKNDMEDVETEDTLHDPVTLPHLTNLALLSQPFNILCPILAKIRAPNCFEVDLETESNPLTASEEMICRALMTSFAYLIPSFRSRLLLSKDVGFTVDGITLRSGLMSSWGASLTAEIGAENGHALGLFKLLHDQLQDLSFRDIALTFCASRPDYEFDRDGVLNVPFVRCLELDLDIEDTHEFLAFLRAPIIRDELAEWLLPCLQRLTVRMGRGHYRVLRMLESRYGMTEISGVEVRLPVALDHLYLDRVRDSMREAIEDVIGKSKLHVGATDSDMSFSTDSEAEDSSEEDGDDGGGSSEEE